MKEFLSHQHKRFGNAVNGFLLAYTSDKNFRLQVWSGLFFLGFAYLMKPLTDTEAFFLVLSYILILITELQNTSFEVALDRIHPDHHEEIGASKNIAAAAVLTAGIFAAIVIVTIFLNRV